MFLSSPSNFFDDNNPDPLLKGSEDMPDFEDDGIQGGGLAEMADGSSFCTVCQKVFKSIQIGTQHYNEQHQKNQTVQCEICHQVCIKRSKNIILNIFPLIIKYSIFYFIIRI